MTRVADSAAETVNTIREAFTSGNWMEVGRAILQGIADGFMTGVDILIDAANRVVGDLIDSVTGALGIHSPSRLFFDIGSNTMQGMALGIQKAAGLAALTMQGAMARVASAAVPSVTNSTVYNNTSNYNLNINSSAQSEPIAQDFALMQSLAGV
jgi:hypothetical protein